MPSRFADRLIEDLKVIGDDELSKLIAKTAVDIALIEVREALGHATYRNHDHSPSACSACEQLKTAAENLKFR